MFPRLETESASIVRLALAAGRCSEVTALYDRPMRLQISVFPLQVDGAASAATATLNAMRAAEALRAMPWSTRGPRIALLAAGVLSGHRDGLPSWPADAAIAPLLAAAQDLDLYIAFADRFAGETLACVLSPEGRIALTQRSITDGRGVADVQVLQTPEFTLACLPGDDVLFPEYVRAAVFRGAEIVLNPCWERCDAQSAARHYSRGARAWENHLALASVSLGAVRDAEGRPSASHIGRPLAEIWGIHGDLLAESGDSSPAQASVDLQALRSRRAEPWVNFPAQLRTAVYAGYYARAASGELTGHHLESRTTGPAYDVLMMQSHQEFAQQLETREATLRRNLQGALGLAAPFCARPTTRLAVFPEFFLQGSAIGQSLEWWASMGIRIPGPETAQLAEFARRHDVYLCGAVLEYDPAWPRRYFNTSIIIDPQGQVVLRYRKLQCADLNGLLNVTTPGSIHSDYLAMYGADSTVPVVDTPIGRLGTAICFDSNWPELWRVLALKGAEVICNPTSEIHSERRSPWYRTKRAHAAENLYYVASANAGSEQLFEGAPITSMNRGHSALIDFHGGLASCADGPGIVPLLGHIDLGALRSARADAAENTLARFRPEAVAELYRQFPGFPLDCFLDSPMQTASEGPPLVIRQIARLQTAGVLRRPQ